MLSVPISKFYTYTDFPVQLKCVGFVWNAGVIPATLEWYTYINFRHEWVIVTRIVFDNQDSQTYFPSGLLTDGRGNINSSGELLLYKAKKEDEGLYECQFRGKPLIQYHLIVWGKPFIACYVIVT